MKLAFADAETGGLDPLKNPLLSLGAVCDGYAFEVWIQNDTNLVVEAEAAAMNGWPGRWEAKMLVSADEAIKGFVAWCQANGVTHVTSHNAGFDASFLRVAASRAGLHMNLLPRFLCTASMAHILNVRGELNTASLSLNAVVRATAVVANRDETHDASEDAELCEAVYKAMSQRPQTQTNSQPRRSVGWGFSSSR